MTCARVLTAPGTQGAADGESDGDADDVRGDGESDGDKDGDGESDGDKDGVSGVTDREAVIDGERDMLAGCALPPLHKPADEHGLHVPIAPSQ